MTSRWSAIGLLFSALAAVVGCAGAAKPPAAAPGPPAVAVSDPDPKEVARAFWVAIAARDTARVAELASFPFDLDAHEGCVESKQELLDLMAKQMPPPDVRIEIGEVGEVPLDRPAPKPPSWKEGHWRSHLALFTAADAKCLGAANAATGCRYYFVEFTVRGEAIGSLTRLRCHGDSCAVAGTDN
jgi:hypothetical protein